MSEEKKQLKKKKNHSVYLKRKAKREKEMVEKYFEGEEAKKALITIERFTKKQSEKLKKKTFALSKTYATLGEMSIMEYAPVGLRNGVRSSWVTSQQPLETVQDAVRILQEGTIPNPIPEVDTEVASMRLAAETLIAENPFRRTPRR